MKYLGYLIKQKCVDGAWTPLKASKENLGFSHLLFADNIILFGKVDPAASEAILEVLGKFCAESGLKISLEKSHIYFSPNVNDSLKEEVCDKLGIQEMHDIGKYLGFPFRHRGAPRNPYMFIVEKVTSKLAGWKAKYLSFAKRVVLIKSVMSVIPTYVMQGVALPVHVCEKLDKINQDLFMGLHNIPVKSVLADRGINCDKACPMCKLHEETIVHLIRDCEVARDLWCKLGVPLPHINSFNDNFVNWLRINSLRTATHNTHIPWCMVFLNAVWCLWKYMNNVVLENSVPNSKLDKFWLGQAREFHFYVSKINQVSSKISIPVRWNKPSVGGHKLNTNGASIGNPSKAGGGGVIKGCCGVWVKGYSRAIGYTTSVLAKWWALRDGLILAIQLGIN
ncbi:uncharacterized protein LOC142639940 [Castanea sativa]|uniref:uncharacterized protein LOC142639940 n=1 Tax=Castanea sativa TaxID=21020 RepID=UPI003F6520C8